MPKHWFPAPLSNGTFDLAGNSVIYAGEAAESCPVLLVIRDITAAFEASSVAEVART
jgi:hypothetical protein